MSKREYPRFPAEQKLEILRKAEQPTLTVSEVCRRHGLSPSVLYRWQAVARGGGGRAEAYAQRAPPEERTAICGFALRFQISAIAS